MNEMKNLFKGTLVFAVISSLMLLGFRFLAAEMNAGSAGFNLSAPFFLSQVIVIIFCYIAWYCKVNRRAADMMNIAEMRKMAEKYMGSYLFRSILITLAIGVAALAVMVLDVLRIGIPAIYCWSSVCAMFFSGNLALFLMMHFALPNRITGSY